MTQDTKPSSGSNQQDTTDKAIFYPELALEEVAAIAPLNRNNAPDLYNHMPSRMVPVEESKYRKWSYFFASNPCRYGHVAPRYTANIRLCVDCHRLKRGKSTIGEKTGLNHEKTKSRGYQGVVVKVEKPEEVDVFERKFLEAYAYHKEFGPACKAADTTEAKIESRLSYSAPFAKAYYALEDRLGIKKVVVLESFEWTEEKYDRLIEVYINTGDLATAREAIGVTPFEYFKEISRNGNFATRKAEADPIAHEALVERAKQLALAGNDKLLTLILGVVKPEYKPTAKIEMNVTEKLDDRQINARLSRLLDKLRPTIIEATVIEAEPIRAITASGTID